MGERINTIQAVTQNWESQLLPDEERTPQGRFDRMLIEVEEARQEVEVFDGSIEATQKLGYEIADVMIIALGVLSSLGLDAERMICDKLETNHIKYNILQNKALQAQGLSAQQAMAHQKQLWIKK